MLFFAFPWPSYRENLLQYSTRQQKHGNATGNLDFPICFLLIFASPWPSNVETDFNKPQGNGNKEMQQKIWISPIFQFLYLWDSLAV